MKISIRDDSLTSPRHRKVAALIRKWWQLVIYVEPVPAVWWQHPCRLLQLRLNKAEPRDLFFPKTNKCRFKNVWTDPKGSAFGAARMLAWLIEFTASFYWNFWLSDFRQSRPPLHQVKRVHEPLWHRKPNLCKSAVLNVVNYRCLMTSDRRSAWISKQDRVVNA